MFAQTAECASFALSAFGDEIDDDVDTQLDTLAELDLRYLEMRTAWGKKAADLSDREAERLAAACRERSTRVSCIGSRIGKSPITEPLESSLAELGRILDLAERLNTKLVRIFSFRPPLGREGEHVDESLSRLKALAEVAGARGVVLVMENETGMVGDTPERCRTLLQGVDSPSLRFVWDIGNFPHSGVDRAVDRGWPLLGQYVAHVQVKDTRLADRVMTVAGAGDGQALELLGKLRDAGYRGFLALEPHVGDGAEGMKRAARALRGLMGDAGCIES
ncbi:MAG: sugar phosphate isomerase/epimerase [Spirochaetaceae bacterium]|nr:sugar phosphate isomerase/epimerase [Spirochaetaceae bacterium]